MEEQLKIDNEVVNHLLFHKALVDKQEDAKQINRYLSLVNSDETGEVSSFSNPFDQSIALMFDLVLSQGFDPWNIDLVNFSSMYLDRAKKQKVDLITAGRIIYMAWRVLRLQSDTLVQLMESKQSDEEVSGFDWADLPMGDWLNADDGYSYANLVMSMPEPPLEEPVRRTSQRRVTLMELLDAFDQARRESEEYQLLDKMRRKERERLAAMARKHMKGTAHEDHLEEDVAQVWNRICHCDKQTMQLQDICDFADTEDRIRTFLSVLFLAYNNKIRVYQRQFPYGKIFIKNI